MEQSMHEIAQKQDPLARMPHLCTRACLELEPPFANYPFGTFAPSSSHSHSHSDAIKNEAKRDD